MISDCENTNCNMHIFYKWLKENRLLKLWPIRRDTFVQVTTLFKRRRKNIQENQEKKNEMASKLFFKQEIFQNNDNNTVNNLNTVTTTEICVYPQSDFCNLLTNLCIGPK